MRALENWMLDAVEAMCEGEFPEGLREELLETCGPGSAWEAGTMDPGDRCPNFGHEEASLDCLSCGVVDCLVPENVFFPTSNLFDVVIHSYPQATGSWPLQPPESENRTDFDGIPF